MTFDDIYNKSLQEAKKSVNSERARKEYEEKRRKAGKETPAQRAKIEDREFKAGQKRITASNKRDQAELKKIKAKEKATSKKKVSEAVSRDDDGLIELDKDAINEIKAAFLRGELSKDDARQALQDEGIHPMTTHGYIWDWLDEAGIDIDYGDEDDTENYDYNEFEDEGDFGEGPELDESTKESAKRLREFDDEDYSQDPDYEEPYIQCESCGKELDEDEGFWVPFGGPGSPESDMFLCPECNEKYEEEQAEDDDDWTDSDDDYYDDDEASESFPEGLDADEISADAVEDAEWDSEEDPSEFDDDPEDL
jgi:hypothetical protein